MHHSRLQERDSREEEHIVLARVFNQTKKGDRGSSSRGRGPWHRRHSKSDIEEEENKLFDKTEIKCYNC